MSDCSTEAMKPKRYEVCPHCEGRLIEDISEYEPSLTHLYCLDCGCSVTRERKEQPISSTGIYAEDLQKCVELIAGVTGAPIPDCPCNLTDVYHSVKDLQQRSQQLEQVARDMLHEFENANNLAFNGHTDVALDVIKAAVERYRGKIEDCGVSLND